MNTVEILKKICGVPGVSGAENSTACVIKEYLSEFTDDISTDALGNLKGVINKEGKKGISLYAHMDKIGLTVTGIDKESGFLRIYPVGGVDARVAAAQRVKVYGKKTLDGVIISTPPHLAVQGSDRDAIPVDKLAVDCGLEYSEISELVSAGDRIEIRNGFFELKNGRYCTEYADNSVGCTVILKTLEYLGDRAENTKIECIFSTREEVGKGGAKTAAFASDTADALVFDVSFATAPGVSAEHGAALGSGVMIGCSPILQKDAFDLCVSLAEEKNIPHTVEVMGRTTGTDADVTVNTAGGKRTALMSVPLRNMHTPVETVQISDIESCAKLACEYILRRNEI